MYLNEDHAMKHEGEAAEDARAQSLLQTELDPLVLDPSSERVVALRVSIRVLTKKIRKTADVTDCTPRTRTMAAPRRPPNLQAVTASCTAASSVKAFLRDTTATVVAAQELHLLGDGIADLGTWAARNRWGPHRQRPP